MLLCLDLPAAVLAGTACMQSLGVTGASLAGLNQRQWEQAGFGIYTQAETRNRTTHNKYFSKNTKQIHTWSRGRFKSYLSPERVYPKISVLCSRQQMFQTCEKLTYLKFISFSIKCHGFCQKYQLSMLYECDLNQVRKYKFWLPPTPKDTYDSSKHYGTLAHALRGMKNKWKTQAEVKCIQTCQSEPYLTKHNEVIITDDWIKLPCCVW